MKNIWKLPFKIRILLGLSSLAFSQILLFHLYFIQIEYKFRTTMIGNSQEEIIFIYGAGISELKQYYKI